MAKNTFIRDIGAPNDIWRGRRLGTRAAAHGIYVRDGEGNEVLAAEVLLRGFRVTEDADDSNIAIVDSGTGLRELVNNTGRDVGQYEVVVTDPSLDDAFTDTTTAQVSDREIGVTQAAIADGESGPVLFSGFTPARVTGAATRGNFLETSTTAGEAGSNASRREGSFAVILEEADPSVPVLTGTEALVISQRMSVLQTAGTAMTIDMPECPEGMLLVLALYRTVATTPTIAGWTRIGATAGFYYYQRVASSEPASYAASWSSSSQAVALVVVLDGIDTSTPVAGSAFDATTAAAVVAALADASYFALAGVASQVATPSGWLPLDAGRVGTAAGTATIVQSASAQSGDGETATTELAAAITPGNLLVAVVARRGGGAASIPNGGYSDSVEGPFRGFSTLESETILASDPLGASAIVLMYRYAVGDEQVLEWDVTRAQVEIYEVSTFGNPVTFETKGLSGQTGASTKSLGAFGTAGAVQIAGFITASGILDQVAGTGYSEDSQTSDESSGSYPTLIVEHSTGGNTPQVTGGSYEWAGVAVGITSATTTVAGLLVGKLFDGTTSTSPFTGASAQNDALIALKRSSDNFIEIPIPLVLMFGVPDLGAGGAGATSMRPLMAYDPAISNYLVVVDGDGNAVMVEA